MLETAMKPANKRAVAVLFPMFPLIFTKCKIGIKGHGYTRIYAYGRIEVFERGNSKGKRR